ncbi:class I SAM-dependent methyltransferase [Caenispirillum salinarum]|uniref:class I SAM-dependent methyltransferase n=1 Tax=Caenispirillum salinarum TaxID=859058 RepID=UPI0012670994|nr:methyltransferase domain-containing protein [Caenispirillum salinarum]
MARSESDTKPARGLLGRLRRGKKERAQADASAARATAAAEARKKSLYKPERPPEKPIDPAWPPHRVRLMDRLWGMGHSLPGGDEYILEQFRVFSPSSAMSMLQVNAGMGGDGRSLALNFGTWVTSIEVSDPLVESGMKESYKHGLEKKAPVISFNPERMKVRPNGFDVVFSRLGLHRLPDKEKTIEQMCAGVKPAGHLLLIEFMPGDKPDPGALEHWAENEPSRPHLIPGPRLAELIRAEDMDLRVVQDVSPDYRKMVMQGFATLMAGLKKKHLQEDRELGVALMREAEIWMRRLALMDSGVLKIVRFHAIAPASKRKKKKPPELS